MRALLKTLTRKEKIGQLMQLAPYLFIRDLKVEVAGHVRALHLDEEKIFLSGSILGIGSAKEMKEVQTKYLEKSRHKIPLLFMADIIHGYKTIFPVPLAMAASFNPTLVEKAARISALEASTAGIHVTFSPMADIARDPRWGRVVEGFGEDPFLAGEMASAMVRGYQTDDLSQEGAIASCVKHFAGYGAAEGGRDYNTVDLSRQSLQSTYLVGYQKAIEANARLIMTAFNVVDSIPCTVNPYLLRDVLRDQWKFDGVTISDYDSLQQIRAHGVAQSMKEVAYKGITAGLDIEMASTAYINHLDELIEEGSVSEALLDEAVLRILKLKQDLGLFENPYKGADEHKEETLVLSEEHLEASLEVAHESIVLLQNNNQTMPLSKSMKIALIGPYAQSRKTIGPWSWHGRRDLHKTLEEALSSQVVFCKSAEQPDDLTKEDLDQIKKSDVVVLAMGEDEHLSGEAHSLSDIHLPQQQNDLFDLVRSIHTNVVVVLHNGRPLILTSLLKADAILECFFLGSRSADAIRDILFGDVNPSGKLPISYPKSVGQIPLYYNHLSTGRPYLGPHDHNEYVSRYLDIDNDPLFPFGWGLSYAKFEYHSIALSQPMIKPNETVTVTVEVENTANRSGYETIQLYIRDHFAKLSRPVKELKQFKKVWFEGNMKQTVSFSVSLNDLTYRLADGTETYDLGTFTIFVGSQSNAELSADFKLY